VVEMVVPVQGRPAIEWGPLQLSPIATTMTDDLDGSRIGAVKNETDHVTCLCGRTPARNVRRATHSLIATRAFMDKSLANDERAHRSWDARGHKRLQLIRCCPEETLRGCQQGDSHFCYPS
jgi:hypothetical protein